jgi:UBX domain-containing protein 1
VLTLWKTGFTVDDGPIRAYNDPQNLKFIEYIKKGELPPELSTKSNEEILLDIIDKRAEDYKKPPSTPFSGSGHSLGSTNNNNNNNSQTVNKTNTIFKLDDNLPTTTIQIRLNDGSKIIGKFNLNHKISDIRSYINR